MVEIKKAADIGMRAVRVLANMPQAQRLDFIAEGLPILMKSADELFDAADALGSAHPRGAAILDAQANEELAKVLIFMDLARCPKALWSDRTSFMINWFYNHLARLIYLEAQYWRPATMSQLQDYVDDNRRSHYLDGPVGEYIFPNSAVFQRESQLYADAMIYDDGRVVWNTPENDARFSRRSPGPRYTCNALRSFGALSRSGLEVVAGVWGKVDFTGAAHPTMALHLTREMIRELETAGLITAAASKDQVNSLINWQMPMYRIDFSRIDVPLSQLEAEREANLWHEAGDNYSFY